MTFSQTFSISVGVVASGASATLTLAGTSYTFAVSSGTELDPYVDPDGQFTQRNIVCTTPGLTDFRAYYRPDVTGREEWIFELGNHLRAATPIASVVQGTTTTFNTTVAHNMANGYVCQFSGISYTYRDSAGALKTTSTSSDATGKPPYYQITVTSPTQFTIQLDTTLGVTKGATAKVNERSAGPCGWDLAAYTVTITRANGTVIPVSAATSPPAHYWFGRWRWQSAVRPVRKTPAQLAAAKLAPRYDLTGVVTTPFPTLTYPTPMTYASVTVDQVAGGDYFGLGFITAHQAHYLSAPSAAQEANWRASAEASGTFQVHFRDLATNAPIDMLQYPNLSMYGGAPNFFFTHRNNPDGGHFGSLTWIPWLLTGDPYYLEEHQYWITHIPLRQPAASRWGTQGQSGGRYFAWPLRHVAQALIGCPANVPSWLKNRTYWIAMLDQNRAYANSKMADTDPWSTVFRGVYRSPLGLLAGGDGIGESFWANNFICLVASFLVWAGRTEWTAYAVWTVYAAIQRVNGTSGWPRQAPDPYFIPMRKQGKLATAMTATSGNTLTFKFPYYFNPGDVCTIEGTETVTFVSTTDNLTWNITRTNPKAHGADNNQGAGLVWPTDGGHFTQWSQPGFYDTASTGRFVDQPGDVIFQPVVATSLTYPSYHLGALAMSLQAGLTGPDIGDLQAGFTWLNDQIRTYQGASTDRTWAQWWIAPS